MLYSTKKKHNRESKILEMKWNNPQIYGDKIKILSGKFFPILLSKK